MVCTGTVSCLNTRASCSFVQTAGAGVLHYVYSVSDR